MAEENIDFRVGDLVRVTYDGDGSGSGEGYFFRVGDVGRLLRIDTDGTLLVNFAVPENPGNVRDDGRWFADRSAMELGRHAPYTVLLLRPDYMADSFGSDTFMTHVVAEGAVEALRLAREEVIKCDHEDVAEFHEYHDPTDYVCLLLIAGHHNDINPEA